MDNAAKFFEIFHDFIKSDRGVNQEHLFRKQMCEFLPRALHVPGTLPTVVSIEFGLYLPEVPCRCIIINLRGSEQCKQKMIDLIQASRHSLESLLRETSFMQECTEPTSLSCYSIFVFGYR